MVISVKKWIVLTIKNLFFYLGYTIERIPDADSFFSEFRYVNERIQKYEFKKLALKNKLAHRHKQYNELLKKFIPNWTNNLTSAEFIGNGSGEENLCVYRKVCFDNKYYFEKVYFSGSFDLLKVEWFFANVYPVLKSYLNTTKLNKVIKGDLITVAYFEYIDLNPPSKEVLSTTFFNFSRTMFLLSKQIKKSNICIPDFIKDYTMHFHYIRNVEAVKGTFRALSLNGLTSRMIEQTINLQPLIFTHGDLFHTNVYDGNYLIDWDSFGFFPQGFESAFIFFAQAHSPLTLKSLQETLVEEYKEFVPSNEWDGFELSCLYFYLVFTALDQFDACPTIMQKDIFQRIEGLYNKIAVEINA